MCDYCLKHGAGKRWYLNADNYRKNFERDEKRENFIQEFMDRSKRAYEERLKGITPKPRRRNWLTRKFANRDFAKQHAGQVVPFEEAQAVLDIAGKVSLIPCVCRMASEGRMVKLCMPFMTVPEGYFNNSHSGGRNVEKLTLEEAKAAVKDFYLKGYVQSIWTFMTPHIGALCNCDFPSCAAIRARRTQPGTRSMLKSEFISKVDQNACTGCGTCVRRCQFGAINLSLTRGRAYINPRECFGCGVCRSVCPSKAISIGSRLEDSVAAELW